MNISEHFGEEGARFGEHEHLVGLLAVNAELKNEGATVQPWGTPMAGRRHARVGAGENGEGCSEGECARRVSALRQPFCV